MDLNCRNLSPFKKYFTYFLTDSWTPWVFYMHPSPYRIRAAVAERSGACPRKEALADLDNIIQQTHAADCYTQQTLRTVINLSSQLPHAACRQPNTLCSYHGAISGSGYPPPWSGRSSSDIFPIPLLKGKTCHNDLGSA